MNETRFDAGRSAAIRSMLIQTVDAEPARVRRVHLRVAVLTVLAALGLTAGGAAVAVALSGGSWPGTEAPAPVESSAPAPTPTVTTTPTSTPAAPSHPLAITGDRILPVDLVAEPAAAPRWSIDLPTVGTGAPGCTYDTVTDVADGYALVEQRLIAMDDMPERCDVSANELAVTLVDTALGESVWTRQWSWAPSANDSTTARLLGTSGRVLIWDSTVGTGAGPAEVLDLATGDTLGPVTTPDGLAISDLNAIPGESGDVTFSARRLDANGQDTTSWSVMRADPLALGSPRWAHEMTGEWVSGYDPIGNSSSILDVLHARLDGSLAHDVLDVDTGAVMAEDAPERSYIYFDGFTMRTAASTPYGTPTSVAGIDDAGNEFWARQSDSGIAIGRVNLPGEKPAAIALNDGSDVALITAGNRMELIDGLTGQTKWTTDSTACGVDPATFDRSGAGFTLQPDGVLLDVWKGCAFDYATGAPVDVGDRHDPGELGSAVAYEFTGGWGSGGQSAADGVIPDSGTATAVDAVTGAVLWTRPIASDERWVSAGGYVVALSQGRISGIG